MGNVNSKFNSKNVVSIQAAREKQHQLKKEENFKLYLKSLKQEQLQYEANYLLNRIDMAIESNQKNEILLKSALLMDEIAQRVSNGSLSASINDFAQDIREKTKDERKLTTSET